MRIAIVNDLSLAREVLRRLVLSVPNYRLAWMAEDGDEASRMARADRPDVVLMDLVMPRVNGVESTRAIMKQSPCPILVVTSTIAGNYEMVIQAMGAGALDAVETPVLGPDGSIQRGEPLLARLAKLASANAGAPGTQPVLPAGAPRLASNRPPLVLIGSSTGGPDALVEVLSKLPMGFPAAVVVAQHIAAEFAPSLVKWLGDRCAMPVRSAVEGDGPAAGAIHIAVTNDHLEITSDLKFHYTPTPDDNPYRPSVDVLFASAAGQWPLLGVAAILTGMGSDGAAGLSRLRTLGWHTIAQDQATCVVYGMPKAAVERQAVVEILTIQAIGPTIAARILGQKR